MGKWAEEMTFREKKYITPFSIKLRNFNLGCKSMYNIDRADVHNLWPDTLCITLVNPKKL